MNENFLNGKCPCCGKHCDMNALQCGRGRQYKETGIIPEESRKGSRRRDGEHCGERHHKHRRSNGREE